jgi:cold shock CspA family protein
MFSATRLHLFSFRFTPILLDTGRVDSWGKNGYGFIRADENNSLYFVHNKNCIFANGKHETHRSLHIGSPVEYDLVPDAGISRSGSASGKFCCVNVTSPGGKPLPSGPMMNKFDQDPHRMMQSKLLPSSGSTNLRGRVVRIWDGGKFGWIRPFSSSELQQLQQQRNNNNNNNSVFKNKNAHEADFSRLEKNFKNKNNNQNSNNNDNQTPKQEDKTGLIFFHSSEVDPKSLEKFQVSFTTDEDSKQKEKKQVNLIKAVSASSSQQTQKPETIEQESNQQQQTRRRVVVKKISPPTDEAKKSVDSPPVPPIRAQQKETPSAPPAVLVTSCELRFDDEVIFDVKTIPDVSQQPGYSSVSFRRRRWWRTSDGNNNVGSSGEKIIASQSFCSLREPNEI